MYVFIYIYICLCVCVCVVSPPWDLPFWYPPSSPSPEDFFRYPPQLHPRPSAADMPRSLALFSCSNPRLPFDLSPFPLKYFSIGLSYKQLIWKHWTITRVKVLKSLTHECIIEYIKYWMFSRFFSGGRYQIHFRTQKWNNCQKFWVLRPPL